jgi:DNA-binding NarL/FixJ family response regulator
VIGKPAEACLGKNDEQLPRMDGIEATRSIVAQLPQVRVIGLSMHEGQDMLVAMQEAGAVAYLTKGLAIESLMAAIFAAADLAVTSGGPTPSARPPFSAMQSQ